MPFHSVPAFLERLAPGLLWRMPGEGRRIYLTFDDGPVPGPTEFVGQWLERYRARGTFFCVGENLDRYPALARNLLAAGHTLANHTQHHIKGWEHSLAAYVADTEACRQALELVGAGPGARLMRPPYGRITPGQAAALRAAGYRVVMWSILSADYDASQGAGRCLEASYCLCRPGAVVVFHDSYKAMPRLQKVLPALLEVLSGEGYELAAL